MDTNGITPVYPMGSDGGFGMNGLGGIFALLILLGIFSGGFGNGFGGNGNANALSADLQRGFDTQNLQAQTRDLMNTSNMNAANVINAVKDGNAATIREFGNVESTLVGIGGQMQSCCCDILRNIDSVNYNGAINTAAINANTTAQIQGLKDLLYQNKIETLQGQVSALQLQAATSNVLRFPNAWTYAGGVFPPVQTATTVA